MFAITCPVAGAEVLRGPRSVLSMHNTSDGIVTDVRCACGHIVVMVTGQLATEARIHHPLPAVAPAGDVATEPVPVGASCRTSGTAALQLHPPAVPATRRSP